MSVALVGVTGLSGVLAGLLPPAFGELLEIGGSPSAAALSVGRAVLVQAGLLLLLNARLLARGSRAAWMLATAASSGLVVAEVVRERFGLVGGLGGCSLILLLVTRSAYRMSWGSGRSARRLWAPVAAAAGLTGYAVAGYAELDGLTGTGSRIVLTLRTLAFAPGGIDVEQRAVEAYVAGLRVGALVVALTVMWALRRGGNDLFAGSGAARDLAERYGRGSAAPLLALPDNARLPLCGGRALAGLAVRNGVAISLGLPVAPAELEVTALVELVEYCERAGWTPAFLALDQRQRDLIARQGFASQKIGEEAFLDVGSFSTQGRRRSNVRHSVTRARKEGITVIRYDAPARTPGRDAQLTAISRAWLAAKGGPELGFTLGRFDVDRLEDQEVFAAITALGSDQEAVVGFVTWLPYADGDAAVLDLMRRGEICPPGVMEALVVDSLADFAVRGRSVASLGGVPLAATADRTDRVSQLLGWMYEHGEAVYAAKGLFRFKDKFDPRWEPMYLGFPGAADVPRIALATVRAFLPPGAVRELLASRRPHSKDAGTNTAPTRQSDAPQAAR